MADAKHQRDTRTAQAEAAYKAIKEPAGKVYSAEYQAAQFAYNAELVEKSRRLEEVIRTLNLDDLYDQVYASALAEYREDGDDQDQDDIHDLAVRRAEQACTDAIRPYKTALRESLQPALAKCEVAQNKAVRDYEQVERPARLKRDAEIRLANRQYEDSAQAALKLLKEARRARLAIWQRYRDTGDEAELIAQLQALTE